MRYEGCPLQVFAPLARLLGLYSIKEELEALSFMYSDPEGYARVQRRLDVLAKMQGDVVLAVSKMSFRRASQGRAYKEFACVTSPPTVVSLWTQVTYSAVSI